MEGSSPIRSSLAGTLAILVLCAALLVIPQNAGATHLTSPFTEHPSGLAISLVNISQSELPSFPSLSPGSRPSPVGLSSGNANLQLPLNNWLHDPDNGFTGDQSDPISCGGSITVTGNFYGYDSGGNIRPLSWATAWIFDVDYEYNVGAGTYLPTPKGTASALLDDAGYMSSGPFCNRDGTSGQNRKDIVVVVIPWSSAAEVTRFWMFILQPWAFTRYAYSAWTSQYDNVADGTFNIGRKIVPVDTRVDDAFRAYGVWSGVLAGWNLISNKVTPSYSNVPQVEVHYLAPICYGDPFNPYATCPGEPFPHYMVSGSKCAWTHTSGDPPLASDCAAHWNDFAWQIHIDGRVSARNPFVVNHLYAHYVMQRYFGGSYPSNGLTPAESSRFAGDFDENGACSGSAPSYQLYCNLRLTTDYANYDSTHAKGIAWAEGFADAFALRALATRPGGSETSVFSFQRATGEVWSYDFEPRRTSNAESKEQTTAAALRDIDDTAVDGWDSYAGGFDRIWKAFTRSYTSSIRGFWDNWIGQFHSAHGQVEGARDALYQNDLITSRALSLTATLASFPMRISLTWAFTGTNFWKYDVHRSTIPGFIPGASTLIATLFSSSSTTYSVTSFNCETTYYFEVLAFNTAAWPAHSNPASLTTGSCSGGGGGSPFVAPWNGSGYQIDNNILPLSDVFDRSSLDVWDYYRLHAPLLPKRESYSLKLMEFEDERSSLDLVSLFAVDHVEGVRVGVDPDNGQVFTYAEPTAPRSAVDNYGRDTLAQLIAWDGAIYEGWRGDFVELDFGRVTNADARLIITADACPPACPKTRIFIQVWDGSTWQPADTMHHRLNFAEDVIDISRFVPNRGLRVRLVGASHFALEAVGLDASRQSGVTIQQAPLQSAVHNARGDVARLLANRDGTYATLIPVEEILMSFSIPEQRGEVRSFVLVSYGHYVHKYQPYQGEDVSIHERNASFESVIPSAPLGQYWDIEIAELTWDFGDGSAPATGRIAAHVYAGAGEYVVTVRATYTDGHVRLYERRILVP